MRVAVLRSCLLGLCLGGLGLGTSPSARADDLYDTLVAGVWQENWDRTEICGDDTPSFTIHHDRKTKTVNFVYRSEVQGYDGKMRRELNWFVREYRPHSMVLALDGETRKGESGQLLEWEMIFVGRGLYRWRATEWPHREVNRVVGVRCSDGYTAASSSTPGAAPAPVSLPNLAPGQR